MNPPCPMKGDYCPRHGKQHLGHLRALALGTDAKSQAHREIWDRRAGGRVTRFLKALLRHLYHGLPVASESEQQERAAICGPCPLRRGDSCGACGCRLKGKLVNKIAMAAERCPKGHWGPVKGVNALLRFLRGE